MKKLLSYWMETSRATKLLIAATVVAALRLMLINSVFLAVNIEAWGWFGVAEVWSGVAFAMLEGVALAYVSKRWRALKPASVTDWVYWSILLIGQITLLAAIVWVTAYAATATRRQMSIDDLLGQDWAVIWSMLVAAINPLIVILIGIVEDDEQTDPINQKRQAFGRVVRLAQAGAILDAYIQDVGKKTPTVNWLREEFTVQVGGDLPAEDADQAILEWRSRHGISGRRPEEPEVVSLNGKNHT